MSRLLAAALLAALALPAAAQTHLADSSGVYIGLTPVYDNLTGVSGASASVGYRQANGLDYGFGIQFQGRKSEYQSSSYGAISAGATLGYTQELGRDLRLRLESAAGYQSQRFEQFSLDGSRQEIVPSNAFLDVSASVSRSVPLAGSLRLHPSLGLYAHGSIALDDANRSFAGSDPLNIGGIDTGVQVSIPLSFRLFGTDVAVPFSARYSFQGPRAALAPEWTPSMGLRVNF